VTAKRLERQIFDLERRTMSVERFGNGEQ